MPSQKKIEQVKNLTQKLKEANSIVLLDYQGLTHQQLSGLRKKLKEVGSTLSVTKNSLLKLALKSSHFPFPTSHFPLTGPTATLFITTDPISPLKTLSNFISDFGLPKIKIGVLDGEIAQKERILELANLPPREILSTEVIAALKAPNQRLTLALAWNLQKLNLIIKKISFIKAGKVEMN